MVVVVVVLCAGKRRPVFEQACTANLVVLVSPIFCGGKWYTSLVAPVRGCQDCVYSLGDFGRDVTRVEGIDTLAILLVCTT